MMNKVKELIKKVFKSNMGKNYMWVFLGQNIGSVFTTLTIILTLRIISAEEYGALVAVETYALLISNIVGIRTFNGVIKYVTDAEIEKNLEKANSYIGTAFIIDVFSGLLAFACGLICLNPITKFMGWDPATLSYAYMYLPVVLLLPVMHGAPVGMLRKLGCFKQVNVIHAIAYGIQCAVFGITLLLGIKSFKVVLIEHAITVSLECVIVVVYAIRKIQASEKYRNFWEKGISKDKSFLKYNLYYGISTGVDQILGHVSTLLINKYAGNLVTAYVKVIAKICSLISKFTNPVSQIVYPELCSWVAKKNYKKAYKTSIRYFYIVCAFGLVLMTGLFVTYDWWIVIFDPGMVDAKWQAILQMTYSILAVSIICVNQLVFALNLVKQNMFCVIVMNFLYLVTIVPAIKMFGVYGYFVLQIMQLLAVFFFKLIIVNLKMKKLKSEVNL